MRRVLFITTKNLDYIRNVQEIQYLREDSRNEVDVIGLMSKVYVFRILYVWLRLLFTRFRRYEIVFAGFAPQLFLPIYNKRIKRAGCRIAEDFFISLYDTFCLDRKKFGIDSMMGNILHRLDEKTIECADRIICDTKEHGKFFVDEFEADPSKIKVSYIKADKSIYYPGVAGSESDIRQKVFEELFPDVSYDKNKTIVLYFGTGLPLQGTDVVLDAMNEIMEDRLYTCVFVGHLKGNSLSKLREGAGILHRDWLSQHDLARLIDISDICLAGHFNHRIDKALRTIPGKAFIYEAMDKPMILGDNPANREYFKESNRAGFVKMGDSHALAQGIRDLAVSATLNKSL